MVNGIIKCVKGFLTRCLESRVLFGCVLHVQGFRSSLVVTISSLMMTNRWTLYSFEEEGRGLYSQYPSLVAFL